MERRISDFYEAGNIPAMDYELDNYPMGKRRNDLSDAQMHTMLEAKGSPAAVYFEPRDVIKGIAHTVFDEKVLTN